MTDSSEFSPEQAADPGTSMQDMARIAAERPDLWASLAANPSLYPGLREWLGQVDDPAVKEALSASAQRAAERVPAGDESAEAPAAEEAPTDAAPAAEVEDVKADGAEADSAQEAPTAEAVSIEDASEPATAEAPTTEIAVDSAQETPTAAMGTPPPPPARAGGKRRRKKWVPIAAVLAVVLAVGGGTFAVYTYLTQRGAASPDEVMSTVSQAIADKDIISMFKMVSPSEIDTVADSADAIRDGGSDSRKGSSKADPGALLSKDAINNYLEALDVSTSDMTYTVDQKSDDLAVATISSWHLDVRVDQSLADTLRTRYQSAKGSSLTDDEEEFFSDLDFSDLSYDGDVADDFRDDIPLEIVMIKEDGRWFISPLMTSAQWNYRDRAQWDDDVEAPNYEADFSSVKGADSPEAAVQNLTEAILDARRPSDMLEDNVTGLLSLPERRLAMVYGPVMVGDDRKFSERASENVKIDWDLTSTDIGGGQAVVQPGNSKITLNPDDEDEKITFEFKGNTMKVTTPASENNTASVDFTRQLKDPDRLGVVVEKSDGTWHVSSSGTIVNIFNLRPSERALDKFSDTLEDLGVDPDDSDDLADTITQSVAIATPILVGVDIAEQLQDVNWRAPYRPSYDSYDSYSGYSTADYYSQCTSGDMSACDRLYYASSSGSFDESYGRSCGGRNYSLDYGGQCESRYGRWY